MPIGRTFWLQCKQPHVSMWVLLEEVAQEVLRGDFRACDLTRLQHNALVRYFCFVERVKAMSLFGCHSLLSIGSNAREHASASSASATSTCLVQKRIATAMRRW